MERKAPAFQLYVDDFLGGTLHMSAEEVGIYIRLLCCQWSHGPLSERHVRACGGNTEAGRFVVEEKFVKTDAGYVNQRLENVRNLREIRKDAASKGGSKTQANRQAKVEAKVEANGQAKPEQNVKQTGVAKLKSPTPTPTPTPSSVPDPIPTPNPDGFFLGGDVASVDDWRVALVAKRSQEFQIAWGRWQSYFRQKYYPLPQIEAEAVLMKLGRAFPSNDTEQAAAIDFSIAAGCKNILVNGDHRKQTATTDATKSSGQQFWERALAND